MDVTYRMLQAAMRKATEAGLLPRHARGEDVRINQELVRVVVQAALDAATQSPAGPGGEAHAPAPVFRPGERRA